jgi:hypothetical protein
MEHSAPGFASSTGPAPKARRRLISGVSHEWRQRAARLASPLLYRSAREVAVIERNEEKKVMMKLLGMISVSALVLQGCAHTAAEQKLAERTAQETSVKTRADLGVQSERLLDTDPNLSESQRGRLRALRDSIRAENDSLISESLRLRSVLIKDVLAANYDAREIDLIKGKIKKIESKRVALLFDGIDQANRILGREAVNSRDTVARMFEFRDGQRD